MSTTPFLEARGPTSVVEVSSAATIIPQSAIDIVGGHPLSNACYYESGNYTKIVTAANSDVYVYDLATPEIDPVLMAVLPSKPNGLIFCAKQNAYYGKSSTQLFRIRRNGTYNMKSGYSSNWHDGLVSFVGSEQHDDIFYDCSAHYANVVEQAWPGSEVAARSGVLVQVGEYKTSAPMRIDPVNPDRLLVMKTGTHISVVDLTAHAALYTVVFSSSAHNPLSWGRPTFYGGVLAGYVSSAVTVLNGILQGPDAAPEVWRSATRTVTGLYGFFVVDPEARRVVLHGTEEAVTFDYMESAPPFVSAEAASPFSASVSWHVRDEHPGPYSVLLGGQVAASGVTDLQYTLEGLHHSTEYAASVVDENVGTVGSPVVFTTPVIGQTGVSIAPRWLEPTLAPDVALVMGPAVRTGARLQGAVVHAARLAVEAAHPWDCRDRRAVTTARAGVQGPPRPDAALAVHGPLAAGSLLVMHDAEVMEGVEDLAAPDPAGPAVAKLDDGRAVVLPDSAAAWIAEAETAGLVDYPALVAGAVAAIQELDERLGTIGL